MTFGMAAVLLILIIAGIILAVRGLQQRKILCIIIIVLLSVFGLALAVYMGLTMLFCGCGAEPAACVTVQNGGNRKYREYFANLHQ